MNKRYNTRGVRVSVSALLNRKKRKKACDVELQSQGHRKRVQGHREEKQISNELPQSSGDHQEQAPASQDKGNLPEIQVFSTVEATLLPVVEGDILAKLMTVIDSSCGVKIITKGDDLGLCGSWEDVNAARETLAEILHENSFKKCSRSVVGIVVVKNEDDILSPGRLVEDAVEHVDANLPLGNDVSVHDHQGYIKSEDPGTSEFITIVPNEDADWECGSPASGEEDTSEVWSSGLQMTQQHRRQPDFTGVGMIVAASRHDSQHIILGNQHLIYSNFRKPRGQRNWICKHCGVKIRTKNGAIPHLKQHKYVEGTKPQPSATGNGQRSSAIQDDLNEEIPSQIDDIDCEDSVRLNESEAAKEPMSVNDSDLSAAQRTNQECGDIAGDGMNPQTEDSSLDETVKQISRFAYRPRGTLMFTNPAKATKKCPHCDFKSTYSGIKKHVRRYHSGVIFKCDICPRHFGMHYDLKMHRQRHFDTDGKRKPLTWQEKHQYYRTRPGSTFRCDICKHTFLTKSGLVSHMKTHGKHDDLSDNFVLEENGNVHQSMSTTAMENKVSEVNKTVETPPTDHRGELDKRSEESDSHHSGDAASANDTNKGDHDKSCKTSASAAEIITTVRTAEDCQKTVLKNSYLIGNNFTRLGKRLWQCKLCGLRVGAMNRGIEHLKVHETHPESTSVSEVSVSKDGDKETPLLGRIEKDADNLVDSEASCGGNEAEGVPSGTSESTEKDSTQDSTESPSLSTAVCSSVTEEHTAVSTNDESLSTDIGEHNNVAQDDKLLQISKLVAKPWSSYMYKCPEKATEQCPYCDYRTTESAINNHVKRYHSGITYKCDICLKQLGSYYYFRTHRQRHFDSSGKIKQISSRKRVVKSTLTTCVFECDICKLKFYRRCDLNSHKKAHKREGETPVVVRINGDKCHKGEADQQNGEGGGIVIEGDMSTNGDADKTGEKSYQEETIEMNTNSAITSMNSNADDMPLLSMKTGTNDIIATLGNVLDCQKMMVGNNYVIESNLTKVVGKRLWRCNSCGVTLRPKSKAVSHLKVHGVCVESSETSNYGDEAGGAVKMDIEGDGGSLRDAGQNEAGCQGNSNDATPQNVQGNVEISLSAGEHDANGSSDQPVTAATSVENADVVQQGPPVPDDPVKNLCQITKLARKPGSTYMIKSPDKATEKCPHCEFMSSRTGIKSHVKRYHSGIVYSCDICPKKFGTYSDLRYHRLRHFDSDGKLKPTNWRKGYRYRNTTEAPKFVCEFCQQGYYRNCDLKQHLRSHDLDVLGVATEDPNKFLCDMCDVVAESYHTLQLHVNSVHGQKRKCPQCDIICNNGRLLRQHQKYMHQEKKSFPCPECARNFSQQHLLKAHLLRHQGVKRHFCPTCGMGFMEKTKMRLHRLRHQPGYQIPKPFICETCGKRFPKEFNLRDHQNTHTGARPYVCKICGAQFSYRTSLYKHAEVHAKKGTFTCGHQGCGKTFKRKTQLITHHKVHTDSDRLLCAHCDRTFSSAAAYNRHQCNPAISSTSTTSTTTTTTAAVSQVPGGLKALVAASSAVKEASSPSKEPAEIFMCSECNHTSTDMLEIQLHVAQHTSEQNVNNGTLFTLSADSGETDVPTNAVYIFDEISQEALQTLTIAECSGVEDSGNATETVTVVTQ